MYVFYITLSCFKFILKIKVVIITLSNVLHIPGARILEDVILDKIISAIKNGSDCFGNPPLDPLNYEDNIHLENITILDYIL